MEALIAVSGGLLILAVMWLVLKPSRLNFLAWLALMAISFASVFLAG